MGLEKDIFQKKFKSEHHKGVVNILYTYHWLTNKTQVLFKEYDITPQQFNVLRILRGNHPAPCTVSILKERMLDKMSDASRLVERLKNKNLIIKDINNADRRTADIYISDKGLELLAKIDAKEDYMEKVVGGLNQEEMIQLNFLLDKMRAQFQEEEPVDTTSKSEDEDEHKK